MRNQGWPINPQYLAGAPLQILHSVNMIYTRRYLIPNSVSPLRPHSLREYGPVFKPRGLYLDLLIGIPRGNVWNFKSTDAPQTIDLSMNKAPQIDSRMIRPFIFFCTPRLRPLNEHKSSLGMVIAGTMELSNDATMGIFISSLTDCVKSPQGTTEKNCFSLSPYIATAQPPITR